MHADDDHNQGQEGRGRDDSGADSISTSDPSIAGGRADHPGQDRPPGETIVAETSRVQHAPPSYANDPNAFVPPDKARQNSSQGAHRGDNGDQGKGRDQHKDKEKDKKPADKPGPNYLAMGLGALAVVLAAALAYSYFGGSSKSSGDEQNQSKKKDDSKKDDSKKKDSSSGGGESSDMGSEIPGFTSAEDSQTIMKQIQHVSSRIDTLQQRIDQISIPKDRVSPDIETIQHKLGDLSRSLTDVQSLPSRTKNLEGQVDRMVEDLKLIRERLDKIGTPGPGPGAGNRSPQPADDAGIGQVDRAVDSIAGPPPAPPGSVLPADLAKADAAMADGIALFKRGQYPSADAIFSKLQATRGDDARVWYYSALARGFTTGKWETDPVKFVEKGASLERDGKPPREQVDTAFEGLSTAQGKDWLGTYRTRLTRR